MGEEIPRRTRTLTWLSTQATFGRRAIVQQRHMISPRTGVVSMFACSLQEAPIKGESWSAGKLVTWYTSLVPFLWQGGQEEAELNEASAYCLRTRSLLTAGSQSGSRDPVTRAGRDLVHSCRWLAGEVAKRRWGAPALIVFYLLNGRYRSRRRSKNGRQWLRVLVSLAGPGSPRQ